NYRDLRPATRGFPAEKVAGWLRDPNLRSDRRDNYAFLLGQCGTAEHAEILRGMIERLRRQDAPLHAGSLIAYVRLRPDAGGPLVEDILRMRAEPIVSRDAAWHTVRYLWNHRPDVLPRADLLNALLPTLRQDALGDAVVGDLRRWGRWEVAGRVLLRGE